MADTQPATQLLTEGQRADADAIYLALLSLWESGVRKVEVIHDSDGSIGFCPVGRRIDVVIPSKRAIVVRTT